LKKRIKRFISKVSKLYKEFGEGALDLEIKAASDKKHEKRRKTIQD